MYTNPLDLFQFVEDSKIVYGPGRGDGSQEGFIITAVPPTIRRKPDDPLSFHCSSWTNFVLACFTGLDPEQYTHRGNMPSLFKVAGTDGRFMWNRTYRGKKLLVRDVPIQGFGEHTEDLGAMSPQQLRVVLQEPGLYVCGESTKLRSGYWKHWHHTSAFFVDDCGCIYRCAADGFRGSRGYSHTPMRLQKLDDAFWTSVADRKRYRPIRVNWTPLQHQVFLEGQ